VIATEQLALVRGWDDTRATLRRWRARPLAVLAPWAVGSLAIAALLLGATWVIATVTAPDPNVFAFHGGGAWGDYAFILYRNGLVLALHAMACVAGFIAGSSLPAAAEGYSGLWRKVHDRAGPLAIGFVLAATAFSLATQAYALGHGASSLARQLGISRLELMAGILPHALPELFALFLPLAAWMLAGRRGAWNELLAATVATTACAVPLLVGAAAIETWVTPGLLRGLAG
jgi:Stage II sporulation protein M